MGPDLDPYRDWLGVSDPQRPLTHYGLLGLPVGEADGDRIRKAIDSRAAAVKPRLEGPHSRFARKLLLELESAGNCLLDPASKAIYDKTLNAAIRSGETPNRETVRSQGKQSGLQLNTAALEGLLDELPQAPTLPKRAAVIETPHRQSLPRRPVVKSESKSPFWILLIAIIGTTIPIVLLIAYLTGEPEPVTADSAVPPAAQGSAPPLPSRARPISIPPMPVESATTPAKSPAPQPAPVEKPPASPQVAYGWLQHIPQTVELPELKGDTIDSPSDLVRLPQAAPVAELTLALKNPASNSASTRAFFETRPVKGQRGVWAVDYVETVSSKSALQSGSKRNSNIARFELSSVIQFTWLPAALAGLGEQLRNCVLVISLAESGSRTCALRRSRSVEEFIVDLAKTADLRVVDVPGMPPVDAMQLELLQQSPNSAQIGPGRRISRREQLTIDIRDEPPAVQLHVRFAESRGKISVRLQKLYKDSMGDLLPLTSERLSNLKRTLPRELERADGKLANLRDTREALQVQLNQFKAVIARDPTAAVARNGVINTQAKINHVGGQINSLVDRIPRLQSRLKLLKPLEDAASRLEGMRVDFRLVLPVEDVEVEIASTIVSPQG